MIAAMGGWPASTALQIFRASLPAGETYFSAIFNR